METGDLGESLVRHSGREPNKGILGRRNDVVNACKNALRQA